jgi:hypothetical protein
MRVKFLRDELFEHEGRNQGHLYLEGEVYDFEPDFAERWLRRGAVELIDADGKPPKPEARFTPLNKVASRGDESDASRRATKGPPGKGAKKPPAGKAPEPKAPEKPADKPAEAKPEASAENAEKKADEPGKPAPLEPPKPGQAG